MYVVARLAHYPTVSVSWFLLVHMITGTSDQRGSRVMGARQLEAVLAGA